MKALCSLMVVLLLRQATAAVIRKPPAFSAPVFSDSYLPAAMQVIYHTVEQMKLLQLEEIPLMNLAVEPSSATSSIKQSQSTTPSMKDTQPQSTISSTTCPQPTFATSDVTVTSTTVVQDEKTETSQLFSTSTQLIELSSQGSSETNIDPTEVAQNVKTSTANIPTVYNNEESPEINEEAAETNYATPETNHESPEPVQETQETNEEISEDSKEIKSSTIENSSSEKPATTQQENVSQQQSTQVSISEVTDGQKKKEPTIDSVVDEIYGLVKITTSPLIEESDSESKSVIGISIEKMEGIEDDEEETRFTLLGEKVAQVPRPSLNSYLRRAKVPLRPALQQLANLYDSLSKDARKQGFARYAGYSDNVLKTLESSAEGGVGPQLKKLLENVVERNELTRDDAKMKTSEALRDLNNPGSPLNKDLRRLLPLRYMA